MMLVFAAQIVNVASQFLFIFVISEVTGVESVGRFGIISAVVTPIQFFFLSDIGSLLIAKRSIRNSLPYYHSFFIISSSLIIPTSVVLFAIMGNANEMQPLLGYAFYRSVLNYREYSNSIFQRQRKEHMMAKGIIISSLGALFLYSFIYLTLESISLSFAIAGLFLLLFILFYDQGLLKKLGMEVQKVHYSKKAISYFYFHGSKLGINALVNSMVLNSPRYFVEYVIGDRHLLGVITLYTQGITAYGLFNQAITKSTLGTLMNVYRISKEQFKVYLLKLIGFNVCVSVLIFFCILVFAKWLIGVVFGAEYLHDIHFLYIMAAAKSVAFPLPILKNVMILFKEYNSIYLSNLAVAFALLLVGLLVGVSLREFLLFFLLLEALLVTFYLGRIRQTGSFMGLVSSFNQILK